MSKRKRILIVDDEKSITFILSKKLAKLGSEYQINTAETGQEALDRITEQHFDLLITDLRMPGIDGLQLIEKVRAVSPQTRLILMTAYGSDAVQERARRLNVYRYITKPFTIKELIEASRSALSDKSAAPQKILFLSEQRFDFISARLEELLTEVGAQCIWLADLTGHPIVHVGVTHREDMKNLLPLIGNGLITSFEVARHLGQPKALNLNYQEGEKTDLFTVNVGSNLFMVIGCDKQLEKRSGQIGMVWLYTRRAIKDLQKNLAELESAEVDELLDGDFGASLNQKLDSMFDF